VSVQARNPCQPYQIADRLQITELRRHLEAAGQHLLAVENEFTGMRHDPQEMAEVKRVNAQQAKEIEKLKHEAQGRSRGATQQTLGRAQEDDCDVQLS
jgi:hypothetical protein